MCFVSTPKVNTNPPPPEYLHNTFLDNVGPDGIGASVGRNSLRNDATQTDLNAPTVTTGGRDAGLNVPSQPAPVGGPGPNPVAAGATGASSLTPGTVVPTVGGSLAGAVPAYARLGSVGQ